MLDTIPSPECDEPVARLFRELDRAIDTTVEPREFLAGVDTVQARLAEVFANAYGDEYYGRLIALKLANFAVAKWHHDNRHLAVVPRPVSLMFDPSPVSCVARRYAATAREDWLRPSNQFHRAPGMPQAACPTASRVRRVFGR